MMELFLRISLPSGFMVVIEPENPIFIFGHIYKHMNLWEFVPKPSPEAGCPTAMRKVSVYYPAL